MYCNIFRAQSTTQIRIRFSQPEGSPVSLEDLYKELIAYFLNAAPTPHLETGALGIS